MKIRVQYIILALAILGIIALLYPAQTTNPQNRLKAELEANLRAITLATLSMALETDGKLPADWTSVLASFSSTNAASIFVTRANMGRIGPADKVMEWTDFVYVGGASTADPERTVIAYLPAGHVKSNTPYLVAFLNGDTGWLSLDDFTKAMNKSPQQGGPGYPSQGAGSPDP